MSIKSRLRILERVRRGPCSECGDSPASPKMILRYAEDTLEYLRFSPEAEIPESVPEFCPECGRQQWVIFRIVYDG